MAAQPRLHAPEMFLGLHGGVSASTMLFSPSVSHMSSPFTNGVVLGGNGGLVFRYAGHKVCGFQVELNYMHRGWREHSEEATYERHLHYLEIPFLTHLYFGKKSVRGFFNLGPQIGYCVADKSSGTILGRLPIISISLLIRRLIGEWLWEWGCTIAMPRQECTR